MSNILFWKFGVATLTAVTLTAIFLYQNYRKKSKIAIKKEQRFTPPNLSSPSWVKVGKIKELYLYPLNSGRAKKIAKCDFTPYGISFTDDGRFTLRDRMFVIYNDENNKIVTAKHFPTLVLVNMSSIDTCHVLLEVQGYRTLVFRLPQKTDSNVRSIMCYSEIECIDCGDAVAEWISMFLTGKKSELRIGLTTYNGRGFKDGLWKKFEEVYDALGIGDTGLFSDITSYVILGESSIAELNKRLKTPVSELQFRPNIIISGTKPFVEDKWDWIKIGNNVILHQVLQCSRCIMSRINPETAVINDEPLEVLRSFRAETDPIKIAIAGKKTPLFGICCGLYSIYPGRVAINDNVYVYVP